MATINDYLQYAETTFAAYASLMAGPQNKQAYIAAGMADAQADAFNAHWTVLTQSASDPSGFSAVLLQNVQTGEKVLAIRGTEGSQAGADYITDFVDIVAGQLRSMPQAIALESFYQQLLSTGKLGAAEQVTVTGHSLGGFLAQSFTALHDSVVRATYTYNAPGFNGAIQQVVEYMGLTDASVANAKIINLRATDGLSLTAGLGQMLGSVQQVRIEAGTADPIYYHSILPLSQSLTIYDSYARLQPSITMAQANDLFVASGKGERRQEDALDALRTVFIGSASNDTNNTPTGDRDRFYINLQALQNDAGFKTLGGQVKLAQANAGFASAAQATTNTALAYRYALLELLPYAVVASSDAQNSTLYGNYTQRLSLYDPATGQGQLTTNWLTDRAAMLASVVYRNQYDTSGVLTPNPAQGIKAGHYLDVASNTELTVGLDVVTTREFAFGGDAADTLLGRSAEDHLYGGAGDDTLNGLGGNDHLEGGAGTDTYQFSGAWGTDTILDSDGQGLIQIGGVTLQGGKKITGQNNVWHNEEQGFTFALAGSGASQMLIITQNGNLNTIRVQGWQSGQLGLTMDDAPAAAPAITHTFTGDQRAKLIGIETQLNVAPDQAAYNSYAWNETSWAADGSLTNGIAEADFSDVVYGTAGNDKISGSATLNVFQRSKPGDSWSPPAGQRIHRNTSKVSSKYGGYSHISCSKNITPTRHTPNLAAASARAIRNGALQ
jgi:Ca2+-binding RTX toxin-like protein